MNDQTERQRQISMLLRQLASGLSSYRLFPGDVEQSSFVSAVDRIHEAAVRPLSGGYVAIEIRGRAFVTSEGPLPEDEATYRLAVACYERRVERFFLRAPPTAEELSVMYEALTREIDEVAEAGGVETLLTQAGVTSISLTQVEPHAIDAVVDPESLAPELAELWEKLRHEQPLSVDELETDPGRTAAEIYGSFRDLVAALPPQAAEDPELYRRLHRAMNKLPRRVRKDLVAVLIDESPSDRVAARMVSSITDHQLSTLLIEVGEDGKRDPIEIAEELVARRARQQGLVELVRELAPAIASQSPSEIEVGSKQEHRDTVKVAISDIARDASAPGADATAVRLGFPDTPDDLRAQVLATLRDYLAAEKDLESLERVLELWVKEVQASLLEGGTETPALVEVVEFARLGAVDNVERNTLLTAFKRRILDAPFLDEMFGPDIHANIDRTLGLLEPLGETAAEGLLDVLGEEKDRAKRSALLTILVRLAGIYPKPVEARLRDDRWYVVRNAVNILHKADGARGRIPVLEQASRHEHAAVRREVIWGLMSILGADAASHMKGFITDGDTSVRERAISFLGGVDSLEAIEVLAGAVRSSNDPSLRRRALEEISKNPSAGAPELLRQLSLFRSRPRLPWSLRRYARKLMKGRRGR